MKVSKKELRGIIRECVTKLLTEAQTKIDNFDLIANLLEFNSPDDFYFVQIIKRWKDNQDPVAKQQGIANGTYHGGAWYLKSWRIRSVQDLYNLKPTIIQWCEQNNARAYITVNSRSENDTNSYIKIYQQQYPSTDARYIKADDIIPGQAKSGPAWRDQRLRLFLDIDCKQDTVINGLNVWNETLSMLQKYNIKTLGQYVTPNAYPQPPIPTVIPPVVQQPVAVPVQPQQPTVAVVPEVQQPAIQTQAAPTVIPGGITLTKIYSDIDGKQVKFNNKVLDKAKELCK